MKPAKIAVRLALLVGIVLAVGAITVALAKAALPSLASDTFWDGTISGQITGTIYTNLPFTITARGVTSTTVFYASAPVSRTQPTYVFTDVKDLPVGGYGSYGESTSRTRLRAGLSAAGYEPPAPPVITWTVQVSSPLPCYTVTPTAIITTMTADQKSLSGLNFTALYAPRPATITARLHDLFPPASLNSAADQPASSAGQTPNSNWFMIQFELRRSDGITTLSQFTPYNVPVTFPNALTSPPRDGSCRWGYRIRVHAIKVFGHIVPWRVTPEDGADVVVDLNTPTAQADFQPTFYQVYQPFVNQP